MLCRAAFAVRTRCDEPKETVCLQCQGELRKEAGANISEMLEIRARQFPSDSARAYEAEGCTKCDCIVQAAAPSRPIERGMAGPGLLAHVLVSKYCDHQPLYRQSEIYARQGVELERSTMADWVGASSRLLEPLVEAVHRYVIAAETARRRHAGAGVGSGPGADEDGRLWTYVRDDRPARDTAAPAVWFAYSPDRKGEHPARHLEVFRDAAGCHADAEFRISSRR